MLIQSILFKTMQLFGTQGGSLANSLTRSGDRSLPPVNDEILLLPANIVAEKIRKRELTSERVVRAFIERAKLVQKHLNAIIDERFDDAIKDAREVDKFLETTSLSEKELVEQKPLLGLPFTTKDSIQVKGMIWSSGCLRRKDIRSSEDAPVVASYRRAGAIPIALTNVPELLLWFATSNKLYGTTNNPFDFSRTPGGSSGGEAALMSSAGSPLSICSDVGGSIRMPAFHCGLFGHKPTHKVVDWRGTFPAVKDGLEEIFSFGPIARYVDELTLSMKVLAGERFSILRMDEPVDLGKLRIFYLDECDNNLATRVEPYISQAIRDAAKHFADKFGCKVEKAKFKYLKHAPLWYILLFSQNQEVSSLITEDTHKINPFLELCKSLVGQSEYSPSALTVAAAQETTNTTFNRKSYPGAYEKAQATLNLAREEFKTLLGDDGVFFVATLPRTAPNHYASLFEFTNICYPIMMNYLNAPTTQVPLGTHAGLPIGMQVAASSNNDRLTLAVAKELEKTYGGWIKPFDVDFNEEILYPKLDLL